MGPLKNVLGMLPGVNPAMLQAAKIDEKRLKHVEAIVLSMTPKERADPDVLNGAAPAPDREGLGPDGAGSESVAGAVQADAESDEDRREDRGIVAPYAVRASLPQLNPLAREHRHGNTYSPAPRRSQEAAAVSHRGRGPRSRPRRTVHRDARHLQPQGQDDGRQGRRWTSRRLGTGSPRARRPARRCTSLLKQVGVSSRLRRDGAAAAPPRGGAAAQAARAEG